MNRTIHVASLGLVLGAQLLFAQAPVRTPTEQGETDVVEALVAKIRVAEQAATSVRVSLRTSAELPSGLSVTTEGRLRVLRGTQATDPVRLLSFVRYEYSDGLVGVVESSQGPNGIEIYQDNPAFGEVLVHINPDIVADLEWAGRVLDRADLPGMTDSRAQGPLGSGMLDGLRRQFALRREVGTRGEDKGVWLRGDRRNKVADLDPDLPLADRCEVFVRDADHAVLEVTQKQGDKIVQQIVVTDLAIGEAIAVEDLRVDGRGQRVREVQQYLPLFELIEDLIRKAESKGEGADAQRPSRR